MNKEQMQHGVLIDPGSEVGEGSYQVIFNRINRDAQLLGNFSMFKPLLPA